MKWYKPTLLYALLAGTCIQSLPAQTTWQKANESLAKTDWLVKPFTQKAAVFCTADKKDLILYNGLVKRTFRIQPNVPVRII